MIPMVRKRFIFGVILAITGIVIANGALNDVFPPYFIFVGIIEAVVGTAMIASCIPRVR